MKLSIIVLNWNGQELLRQTLTSIYDTVRNSDFEVIVVDNHSTDDSEAMVRGDFPKVKLIVNEENYGFAKGNNIGLKQASGDYLMLLNNDVIVQAGAIEILVDYLNSHPDVAMVGPRLLNRDGSFQHACRRALPTPANSFYHLFGLTKIFKNNAAINQYKKLNQAENITTPTEAISGAAMMLRRSVYEKIGGLDEQFFMYGEDLDYCKRVTESCGPIVYVSEAKIVHLGGESAGKCRYQSLLNFYDAMWLYYKKYFFKKHNLLFNGVIWSGIKLKLFLASLFNFFR